MGLASCRLRNLLTQAEKDVKQKMANNLIPLFPEIKTGLPSRNFDIFMDGGSLTIPLVLLNYLNHRQAIVFASLHLFLNSLRFDQEFEFFIYKRMKWAKIPLDRWANWLRISKNTLRSAIDFLLLFGVILSMEDKYNPMDRTKMYTVNYKHKKITYLDEGEFDYE